MLHLPRRVVDEVHVVIVKLSVLQKVSPSVSFLVDLLLQYAWADFLEGLQILWIVGLIWRIHELWLLKVEVAFQLPVSIIT